MPELEITQTKKWITDVVIGCNFCPFAARVMKEQRVHYSIERAAELNACLQSFMDEIDRLDDDNTIETSFLIFPEMFKIFDAYLDFVLSAEKLLEKKGYNGIYQLASFHPLYCFANVDKDDAANYTNRSPYPMLHLLREASIDNALAYYKNPENIPEQNIKFAREKGLVYMKMLRDSCM